MDGPIILEDGRWSKKPLGSLEVNVDTFPFQPQFKRACDILPLQLTCVSFIGINNLQMIQTPLVFHFKMFALVAHVSQHLKNQ
jgi:hypothetical protein